MLITGYFTAKHFENYGGGNRSKDAILYTIKKFVPIVPYAWLVTLFAWITEIILGMMYQGWTWEWIFKYYLSGDFIFDLLLVSDSYSHPLVGPLWYISAMLIVFPLFSLFIQFLQKYTRIIFCFIVPMLYYGWIGVEGVRNFPHDFLRVFAGMMLGVLIFDLSSVIKASNYVMGVRKRFRFLMTIVEVICFILPIVCCCLNLKTFRLDYLCFCVGLLIAFSNISYSNRIPNRFGFLGRISMPMYVFHWWIGTVVRYISNKCLWTDGTKMLVYYTVSIIFSIVMMKLIDSLAWFQKIQKTVMRI